MTSVAAPITQHHCAPLEWEFVDLLLSDDSAVEEMFEDIVAAEWPPTPDAPTIDPPGATGSTAGADKLEPMPGHPRLTPQHRIHRPGTDGWARERSPPPSR
jgi:hypothetical protein